VVVIRCEPHEQACPSTVTTVDVTSIDHGVRARVGTWPHEPDVVHLVLLDHQMVPTHAHVQAWIEAARQRSARAVRTGALFAGSAIAFERAGFSPIDRLALLELDLGAPSAGMQARARRRPRRLRSEQFDAAAAVDRRAFGAPWGNDREALADVLAATPRHRARWMPADRTLAAFAISGVANSTGYLQRLAVEPAHQGQGHGRTLAVDAVAWMRRRGATLAMVNTAHDNERALGLYGSLGFRRRADSLVILELALEPNR
jgi:ribosomal protein S18 acetylase RimI-like enzyme